MTEHKKLMKAKQEEQMKKIGMTQWVQLWKARIEREIVAGEEVDLGFWIDDNDIKTEVNYSFGNKEN